MAVFYNPSTALDRVLIFDQQLVALPNKLVYSTANVLSNLTVSFQPNDSFEIYYSDFKKFASALLYFSECCTKSEPIEKTIELNNDHFCIINVTTELKVFTLKTSNVQFKFFDTILPLLNGFYQLALSCYCYPAQVTYYLYQFLKSITSEQLIAFETNDILQKVASLPVDNLDHYILLRYIERHKNLLLLLKRIQITIAS